MVEMAVDQVKTDGGVGNPPVLNACEQIGSGMILRVVGHETETAEVGGLQDIEEIAAGCVYGRPGHIDPGMLLDRGERGVDGGLVGM